MSKPRRHLGLSVLVCLSMLLIFVSGPEAGTIEKVDGVPHVLNGAKPSRGVRTLELEERWRIGGEDEEGLLLGLISEVGGDAEGNIYVMDAQLCEVHVFNPAGDHLRTIFRQGEGPGEVYRPRDLVIMPEGVGLAEEFPGKITLVDYTGLPHSRISFGSGVAGDGGNPAIVGAHCAGDHLVCSGILSSQGEVPGTQKRVNFLASFDRQGKELVRFFEERADYNFNEFVFSERLHTPSTWWGYTVASDGRVYVAADRDHYAISVYAPDGKLERVIERDYETLQRTGEEKDRIHDLYFSAVGQIGIPVTISVEDVEPAISFWHRPLHVDSDNRLWVITGRGIRDQAEGILLTYDVFDAEGHFVEQVAVPAEGDGLNDGLFWTSPDHMVQVTGYMGALAAQFGRATAVDSVEDEATPQEVICYRVKR